MAWDDTRTDGETLYASEWNAVITQLVGSQSDWSVLIYRDGSNTVAVNAAGTVISSQMAATSEVVFQAAHDYLTTGGKIVVLAGTYTFADAVNITYHNISVQGTTPFFFEFSTKRTQITGSSGKKIFNINAAGFSTYGIYYYGGTTALYFDLPVVHYDIFSLAVSHCGFNYQTAKTIWFDDTQDNGHGYIGNMYICDNYFGYNSPAPYNIYIDVLRYVTAFRIDHNIFQGSATTDAIYIHTGYQFEIHSIGYNYCELTGAGYSFIHIDIDTDEDIKPTLTTEYKMNEGIHGNIFNTTYGATHAMFLNLDLVDGYLWYLPIHHNTINKGEISIVNSVAAGGNAGVICDISNNMCLAATFTLTGKECTGAGAGYPWNDTFLIHHNYISAVSSITITDVHSLNFCDNALGNNVTVTVDGYVDAKITGNYPNQSAANYTLALSNYIGTGHEKQYVHDNIGYVTENHGRTSVADGGTIAHGLTAAPTWAIVTPITAGEMASVTTMDATNLTVAIKKHDNSAGTTQYVNWWCGVY